MKYDVGRVVGVMSAELDGVGVESVDVPSVVGRLAEELDGVAVDVSDSVGAAEEVPARRSLRARTLPSKWYAGRGDM